LAYAVVICGLATAQDFQKSYELAPGGRVSIKNVSGDVTVSGYNGNAIVVSATKTGRDSELVEIEDTSSPNQLELRVRYPKDCKCDASVTFEVKVPGSTGYVFDRISTASGNIRVAEVSGQITVNTASGNVDISDVSGSTNVSVASGDITIKSANGSVSARSASGDVTVELLRTEGSDALDFSSASGDVRVRVPGNIDADIEMSTLSGSLSTDFPIQVEERKYGPGRRASGRVGSGTRRIRISSASGDVSLSRS
jgi:DUF4097 and DUF4098 domain-containing protein YvlB